MANNIVPFMRAQTIDFFAYGLRPNSVMHVYFADTLVDQYVKPMSDSESIAGPLGSTITSSDAGVVYGRFFVPAGTFLTGTKILKIQDGLDTAYTSKAELVFSSFINSSKESSTSYSGRDITPITNTSADDTSDPFAQTYYVSPEICNGKDGISVTKLGLFFSDKDPSFGFAVEIRTVVNVTPTRTAFLSSKVHLTSDEILTDATGQTETVFDFVSPVYLKAGSYYTISLIPDGNSTKYYAWSGESGGIDVSTNQPYSDSWGKGNLFLPTNSSNWTPISNETVKFNLYIASFESSGSVTLTNKDYEYFNLANTSSTEFIVGERIAQLGSNSNGTINVSANSNLIVGTNTTFTTSFSNGQYITVINSNTDIDILQIDSIANNTSLTVVDLPNFSNTSAVYQKVPMGVVSFKDPYQDVLHIEGSTASNTSFVFANNTNLIVGADSGASAKIATVIDKTVNRFSSIMDHSLLNDTDVIFTASILKSDYSGYLTKEFDLDSPNDILEMPVIVASKSNEILYNSGNKSLSVNLSFSSENELSSPEFKIGKSGLAVFGYSINNDVTNEHTRAGNALAKWPSPISTLNMDAEDIRVYLSAWRPIGTDIAVYVKLLNSADQSAFNDNQWTKLDISSKTVSSYSDPQNMLNYVELEYVLPSAPPAGNTAQGIVTISTASANVVGVNTTFTTSFSNNQVVKISTGLNTFDIVRINTITSNTSMNLTSTGFTNSSSATVAPLTTPYTAFKNQNNSGVVRYFSATSGTFDTYKVFAIKTVLLANTTNIIPIIDSVQGIALSV